ncbi:MAG: hypothetical protein R2810_04805 [Flavobacteriales bacterium]
MAGLPYQAFGYEGPAPLFVQVWHPVDEAQDGPLALGELRERSLDGPLNASTKSSCSARNSAFIEYDLRYPLDADEPIDYAPFGEAGAGQPDGHCHPEPPGTHANALRAPVMECTPRLPELPDENVWMAEHFALRGCCFVSANFHWPLEGAMYGTPLMWAPDSRLGAQTDRFLGLTTSDSVFYIGHSWGAAGGLGPVEQAGPCAGVREPGDHHGVEDRHR